jgi:hypothetical protein
MSGVILLAGCNSPTVKEPVQSYIINTNEMIVASGLRSLDYKKDDVGEWVEPPQFIAIEFAHNAVCFSLEDWLTKIKPTLKEGRQAWLDRKSR